MKIELEFVSNHYSAHYHDESGEGCQIIVCWEDDCKGRYQKLEVIGRKEETE